MGEREITGTDLFWGKESCLVGKERRGWCLREEGSPMALSSERESLFPYWVFDISCFQNVPVGTQGSS